MAVQLPKTIRQWFTPKQACDYLSQAFECEVTHDILKRDYKGFIFESFRTTTDYNHTHTFTAHLEMDAHLRNALQMVFEVDDANFYTIEYKIPQGIYTLTEFYENDFHLNAYYLDFSNITATVTDIFDNIERVIQLNDIKIPSYLVLSDDDAERVSNQYGESAIVGEFGYPRHELDRFIKAQTEPTPETREPKELNTNERNSLHALIYALTLKDVEADLKSAVQHDTGASKTDTASKIKKRLNTQGINLTEKTIRDHIKSAHETAQELKK